MLTNAVVLGLLFSAGWDRPAGGWGEESYPTGEWVSVFNGRSLTGWTPKIRGYRLGVNFGNTFRVSEGAIQVRYDRYAAFDDRFGHLFYRLPFSRYRLRLEYRFMGEQVAGGPGWAWRNSGVMIHCQPPETMGLDQEFPISSEVQLLGGGEEGERPTGNLCTPGTNVVMGGQLRTQHCFDSRSKTFRGDQWVRLEIEVDGPRVVRHFINGEEVMRYEQVQFDGRDAEVQRLQGAGVIEGGWISLQSESHPVDFREIVVMRLD